LVDEIFKMIEKVSKKETLWYGCYFPIVDRNINDVLKAINYLNYKKYKTFLDETALLISWA
jgi:hypothetical protein